jgi:hypothetical protein
MFDPDAHMPRLNRSLVYLGACIIAGLRLARERQVNVRVVPTGKAIEESVDLAYEIFNRVFRKVPERMSETLARLAGLSYSPRLGCRQLIKHAHLCNGAGR